MQVLTVGCFNGKPTASKSSATYIYMMIGVFMTDAERMLLKKAKNGGFSTKPGPVFLSVAVAY